MNIKNEIPSWKDKTILIAEDVDFNYLLIEAVVAKTQAKIIRAMNGEEAVKICKTNRNIDVVLMDLMMPNIDGFQATNEIKKIRKDLPVIAQSAYKKEIEKEKLDNAGFDGFLEKPIRIEDLINVLNKFLK